MIVNTLKKQVLIGLSLFLFFGMLFGHAQSQTIKGKKLLLYTKNGMGYVHENIATSVATLKKICAELGIETTLSEDPEIFLSPDLMSYDAVFFANTNNEAFDNEKQREAFQKFCSNGKGFGGLHSELRGACA